MKKNGIKLLVFGVLCFLTGALAGLGFSLRAERLSERQKYSFLREAKGSQGFSGMLKVRLGLDSEQAEKVTTILEEARQEIKEAGKNFREIVSGIREESSQQIMAILDLDQQEIFQGLKDGFRERHRQRERKIEYPARRHRLEQAE